MIESGQWNYTVIFVDRMERPARSRRQSRFLPALKMFEYSLNIYFLKEIMSAWTLILGTVGLLKALHASAKNCLGSWTINALPWSSSQPFCNYAQKTTKIILNSCCTLNYDVNKRFEIKSNRRLFCESKPYLK